MQYVSNIRLFFQPLAIRISFCPCLDLVALESFKPADQKGGAIEHVCSLWKGGMLGKCLKQIVVGMTQKKLVIGGDSSEGESRRVAMSVQVLQQFIDPFAMILMLDGRSGFVGDGEAAWRSRPRLLISNNRNSNNTTLNSPLKV